MSNRPPAAASAPPLDPNLQPQWLAEWPAALASWSPYTQLRLPQFFLSDAAAHGSGMEGEIAAIRLIDQQIMVNLQTVQSRNLQPFAQAILAHEIGHHVYVPGNLADNARMLAIISPILFGLPETTAHYVANLYGDLMINDRLQRRAGLDMVGIYQALAARLQGPQIGSVWQVYMRTYEILWRLAPGTLIPANLPAEMEPDAVLIARLIRHYSSQWLRGVRRFAWVLFPYLMQDQQQQRPQTFVEVGLTDTKRCGRCSGGGDATAIPAGLTDLDPAELEDQDDDFERELGLDLPGQANPRKPAQPANTVPNKAATPGQRGQSREPFQYGQLLRSLGLNLTDHEITTRYYRERALPHLIPFPSRTSPQAQDPLPEGYEGWDAGEDLQQLDLFGSLIRSPVLIPGVTTVQRVYGNAAGFDPAKVPLDLDIYVDSSGSMPNPGVNISYLALAGTILALSALRAGARVQATLWAGAGQFETTHGFIRDEQQILGIITGYLCGGTAFPLSVLKQTYQDRKPTASPAHLVVISDEGVDTLLQADDKATPGTDLCELALSKARGGGTLVLNLFGEFKARTALERIGFRIHTVTDWPDLISFARQFVRENYRDQ